MSKTLEWQLRNIHMHADDNKYRRTFGVRSYGFENNDAQEKHQSSDRGLVMFTWKASEGDPRKDVAKRYAEQIISVVQVKRLPFILCLKKVDANENVGNGMALLSETMKKFLADLKKTHLIFETETLLGLWSILSYYHEQCIFESLY